MWLVYRAKDLDSSREGKFVGKNRNVFYQFIPMNINIFVGCGGFYNRSTSQLEWWSVVSRTQVLHSKPQVV